MAALSLPSLDETLGVALIGVVASSCLYGITVMQTYLYYKYQSDDPLCLRALIAGLVVLDTLHLALITHSVYIYAVKDFGHFLALDVPTWSILAHIAVTGVSDLVVRGIFCHRVWLLSGGNRLIVTCTALVSLVVFGGSIAFCVEAFKISTFAQLDEISWILYLSFGSGLAADTMIAASMCFFLSKRRTGFPRTDSVVRVLMIYSINTGALTSLCALLCLITYANMPNNFIFIAFYFILPKLFLNSLLASLNARRPLREHATGPGGSIPLSTSSAHRSSYYSTGRPYSTSASGENGQMLRIRVESTNEPKPESIFNDPEAQRGGLKAWDPAQEHLNARTI